MTTQEKLYCSKGTLCWCCEWAAGKDGKCPWANKFEPVPGWKAKPTKVLIASATQTPDGKPQYTNSFDVHECPLFETMSEIKKINAINKKKAEARKAILQDKEKTLKLVERLWIEEHKEIEQIAAETGLSYWKIVDLRKKIKEKYKDER